MSGFLRKHAAERELRCPLCAGSIHGQHRNGDDRNSGRRSARWQCPLCARRRHAVPSTAAWWHFGSHLDFECELFVGRQRFKRAADSLGRRYLALATRGLVESIRTWSKSDHVKKATRHHQVLIEMHHVLHVAGGQVYAESSAEAEQDEQRRGPAGHKA
jgi:hypothetical protein